MAGLGIQVLAWTPGTLDYVLKARPRHLKTLVADPQILGRIKSEIPDCFIVYRRYETEQAQNDYLARPLTGAKDFAHKLLAETEPCRHLIAAYEGLNECGLWDQADRYNEWTAQFGLLMYVEGCPTVAYNFATGNPSGYAPVGAPRDEFLEGLRAYWDHYLDGLRESDYLGLHEYGWPTMQTDAPWQTLRHRFVWEILPADCRKPILITECGLDDGGRNGGRNLGWQSQGISEQDYLRQSSLWVAELSRDPYVFGAHIFHAGSADPGWDSFSVLGCDQVADYIRNQPRQEAPMPDEPLTYSFGFADLHDAHPDVVGEPVSRQLDVPGEASFQRTTKGVLTYTPAEGPRFAKYILPK